MTGGDSDADDGGGIYAARNLLLSRVAVRGNEANPEAPLGFGGGIYTLGSAELVMRDSALTGNVGYNGGGLYVAGGDVSIVNSTIAYNTAGTPDSNGFGGAAQLGGTTLVQGSTVVGNKDFGGSDTGGGFYSGDLTFVNSIMSANRAHEDNGIPPGPGNPGEIDNCASGTYADGGYNIEDGTDCELTDATSRQDTDPRVGPLRHNGGPTNTVGLLPGSPAVNAAIDCEAADQRGLPRILGLGRRCDVGAYELARCGGAIVNRVGTNGPDRLVGTNRRDGIVALAGRDGLFGRGGNDSLCGLNGRDVLYGQRGHDLLLGGRGHDRGFAGLGRDRLLGQLGNDLLVGGLGLDRAFGGPGQDRLLGLGHRDLLFGGVGLDRLYGGPAPDLLNGGPGPDFCHGGPARDRAGRCAVRVRI